MATAELAILIKARDEATAVLRSVERESRGLGRALTDVGKVAAGFLVAGGVVAGGRAIVGQLGSIISEANEAARVEAQLNAVLRSTGGVAGVTAEQVKRLASELQRQTTFGDEAIISGQNLLLTFTGIGKDVFPEATRIMLDMSAALGQDLKSSAIQLGKALNDPVQGINALRRVGVSFSEEQRKTIERLVETGNVAAAQRLILEELAREFGGSAQAQAQTFAGRMAQLGNAIGEVKEAIGAALFPVLTRLAEFAAGRLIPAIQAFVDRAVARLGPLLSRLAETVDARVLPALERLAGIFRRALGGIVDAASRALPEFQRQLTRAGATEGLRALVPSLQSLGRALRDLGPPALALGRVLGAALQDLARWARDSGLLRTALTGVRTAVDGLALGARALAPVLEATAKFLREHRPLALALAAALIALVAVIAPIPTALIALALAAGFVREHWGELARAARQIWAQIADTVRDRLGFLEGVVKAVWAIIRNYVETTIEAIRDILVLVMALLQGDWGRAWEAIRRLAADIVAGIVTDLKLRLDLLLAVVRLAWDVLRLATALAWNELRDVAARAVEALTDATRSGLDALLGAAGAAWNLLKLSTAIAWNEMRDLVQDAVNRMIGVVLAAVDSFWHLGRAIVQGLWDGIKSKWGGLLDWLRDKIGDIWDLFSGLIGRSPSPLGLSIGRGLAEGIVAGWRALEPAVLGTLRQARIQVDAAVRPQAVPMPPARPQVVVLQVPTPVAAAPRTVFVDRIEARAGLEEVLAALGV